MKILIICLVSPREGQISEALLLNNLLERELKTPLSPSCIVLIHS